MLNENTKELSPDNKGESKKIKGKNSIFEQKDKTAVFAVIGCVVCIIVIVYCYIHTMSVGTASATEEYQSVKQEVADNIYDEFYQKAYDISEEQHHVSNRVSITLGSLKEQAKMEVLKISQMEYITSEDDESGTINNVLTSISTFFKGKFILWSGISGESKFTVDLQSSEFIIDNERGYVLLRIPSPELSKPKITNVEVLYQEDKGIIKNSVKVGVDTTQEQLKSAEFKMWQSASSNQEYYRVAKESAERILTNLVKQLNPQIENLTVDVEFIE
jgi:replicative DNA helicase